MRGLAVVAAALVAAALAASAVATSAGGGQRLWVSRYDRAYNQGDVPNALAVSPDGSRVFVTGYAADTLGYTDYGTVAYDSASGASLWTSLYGGPNRLAIAYAIGVSRDGSKVFATGSAATVAYDAATGAQVWAARDGDFATALVVSPD